MLYFYKIILSTSISILASMIEFLPISSTGHIIIATHWLQIENNNTKILEIFIQFGSALAILYFFHKDIIKIINFKINFINQPKKNIHILIAIVPTIVIGLIFYKEIKLISNITNIMYSLIFGSFFLIMSELLKPKKCKIYHINDINLCQSLIIGLMQVCALYPGISRSGITIGTGIALGIQRSVAINFSFIISIPLLIGASLLDLLKHIYSIKIIDIPIFFIGFIISFIISLLFIKILLRIINNTSLIFFGIYRFIIAGLIYFMN